MIDIDDLMHTTDFTIELSDCSDGSTANIVLTDISDSLNPFDSPQSSSWEVMTTGGILTSMANPFELTVPDDEVMTVTLLSNLMELQILVRNRSF